MKRRTFITQSAKTGSLIAGVQFAGLNLPVVIMSESGVDSGTMPLIALAGSNEPELSSPAPLDALLTTEQVRDIVWLALDRDTSPRSLKSIVRQNSWVVVKPNLVTCPVTMDDFHADGIEHWWLVTDLRVVKAVVEYLVERIGPRRVTIAEGPIWFSSGGKLKKEEFVDGWHCIWKEFGNLSYTGVMDEINGKQSATHVDIVDMNEDDAVYVTDFDPHKTGIGAFQDVKPEDPDGTSKKEWTKRRGIYLPKTIMDSDVVISVPVLKTHSSAGVTLCLKNFIGCVHSQTYGDGNSKRKIHQGSQLGLVRGIADLACAIQPDYAVTEGFWATIQQHGGQNGVRLNHNVVVAGGDVVAAEAVCMLVMGYNPLDSDLLRMANMKKLGEWRPDRIVIAGPAVRLLRNNYVRAANTYFARGIRKWLMAGPLKSPLKDVSEIQPQPGGRLESAEWSLLDGDAIIDSGSNVPEPYKLQDCLLYGLPGSEEARKDSVYYLALKVSTVRKDLCGQLLVGMQGGDFRCFFNGREVSYPREITPYDPTPTPFIKFAEGENLLLLEITKNGEKKEPVKLAVNLCDLDGDRLVDIELDPDGEG